MHNLGTLTKTENQKYVLDNKRLRSLSILLPVANKNKSQDKPPPILNNLDDREEAQFKSSNAIDTTTLLAPQNKELTFSNSM